MDISSDSLVSRVREETYLQDRIAALLLATFSGLILFGLTAAWPTSTYDAVPHLQRIEALASALRAGVIFPRWFPNFMFGHGLPVFNYYSPGFYYPPALLHLAGLDLVLSTRLALSIGFAISAWWMYGLSRLYVSFWPAIVSVICFQFFPYRIYDSLCTRRVPRIQCLHLVAADCPLHDKGGNGGQEYVGNVRLFHGAGKGRPGLGRAYSYAQSDCADGGLRAWRRACVVPCVPAQRVGRLHSALG